MVPKNTVISLRLEPHKAKEKIVQSAVSAKWYLGAQPFASLLSEGRYFRGVVTFG